MTQKIGVFTLSGLIIGPVLGSGIVLLPPLAYNLSGPNALYAWEIIMALGAVFAYVFIQLSIISPGNEGVSIAIGKGLGPIFREMASNFIMSAVCFGPVAVLLTASEYVKTLFGADDTLLYPITWGLLLLSLLSLIMGVRFVGKITLLLSSFIGLLLITGSSYVLITSEYVHTSAQPPSPTVFGQTLLLLFWAIIGWEIVGNYVEDIENPKRTLNRAMVISLLGICSIYLLSAFAFHTTVQISPPGTMLNMSAVLKPLFGNYAHILLGIAASGLCFCTYLMIVGGITRMAAAKIPVQAPLKFLKTQNRFGAPVGTIAAMGLIHSIVLTAYAFHWLDLSLLVSIANVFFIGNAILGLLAGYVLIPNRIVKIPIVILIVSFGVMLCFSSLIALALLATVGILSYLRSAAHSKRLAQQPVPEHSRTAR